MCLKEDLFPIMSKEPPLVEKEPNFCTFGVRVHEDTAGENCKCSLTSPKLFFVVTGEVSSEARLSVDRRESAVLHGLTVRVVEGPGTSEIGIF